MTFYRAPRTGLLLILALGLACGESPDNIELGFTNSSETVSASEAAAPLNVVNNGYEMFVRTLNLNNRPIEGFESGDRQCTFFDENEQALGPFGAGGGQIVSAISCRGTCLVQDFVDPSEGYIYHLQLTEPVRFDSLVNDFPGGTAQLSFIACGGQEDLDCSDNLESETLWDGTLTYNINRRGNLASFRVSSDFRVRGQLMVFNSDFVLEDLDLTGVESPACSSTKVSADVTFDNETFGAPEICGRAAACGGTSPSISEL